MPGHACFPKRFYWSFNDASRLETACEVRWNYVQMSDESKINEISSIARSC